MVNNGGQEGATRERAQNKGGLTEYIRTFGESGERTEEPHNSRE